ncbi:uncharacterized protein LOC144864360 isoform X11 [Branchiostoma floridae x Branchiostoma japonicum]
MRTMELALLLLLATVTCTAAEGAIKINIDEELANIADLEEEFHEYGRRGFIRGGLSGGGFSGSGKAGAQGPKYISLSCWKDTGNRAIPTLEGKDARLDGSYRARANAIEKCYQVAKSRGFSVFAVQNGGQCAGSATALSTYRKYGPSAACQADGEGGGWANQVYLITDSPITLPAGFVPKPYFSIGCWKDTRNNPAIPTLEGKDARLDGRYYTRADAIDKCYQVAKSRGFKAFAVRNGGWCAGSATAHKTYNKYGPYTTCRQDGEGGPLGNEVYLISDVFTQNKEGGEVAKVQGPKYISLGCWKDTDNRAIATLEGTDPRLDGSYRARANAIEKCYQVAKSRGYSVFAVQHGGWCAGSATALSTYRKYGPSAACQADGEGGGWANQVYLITDSPITLPAGFVPKPYFSIGCWKDTGNRAIPTLEGKDARLDGSYTARANAIDKCYQVAKSRGFKAFAVQNGGWCGGSATALSTYKKYGPYSTCKTDGEGGAWGNEVYLISDALTSSKEGEKGGGEVAKVQTPKYISLGCWKDTGNRAIAMLEGTDARLDGSYPARKNAIEKCYQVAKSRGFSVFAVQHGGWCAGSANAFSTYRKYGPYSTCQKDGEGGAWGNEVYLITDAPMTLPVGFVPKPYFSIGCWKDTGNRAIPTLEGKDARLDGSYTARADAIEKCYQVAKSLGYRAFAVQNGGWCAGSANALSTYKKYGPYSTCQHDGEGGAWGNEVYLISDMFMPKKGGGEVAKLQSPEYFSLGCWKDSSNRAITMLEKTDERLDGSYTARADAIEKCYQVAKSRGFSVFAVQNGGECFGSATALGTYKRYGPSSSCKADGEGGAWANEVYLIKTGAPMALPKGYVPKPYISLGCWRDSGSRAIPTLEGKDKLLDGSYATRAGAIDKCYQVAKSRGYRIFAVQNGGWCAGSADAYRTYKKYGPYTTCGKDGEGGAWGNEVYLISDVVRANKAEKCQEENGVSYRGTVSVTRSGKTCQHWASQTPQKHDSTPDKHPLSGLDGNYCRNPVGARQGVWCYTTDPSTPWEECAVPVCAGPEYISLGCWKDTGNRAIAELEKTDERLDGTYTARENAIEKCYQVAKSRGFFIFAVQNGGWCAGAGTGSALVNYRKYGPSASCKKDGEGGPWANEVYLITGATKIVPQGFVPKPYFSIGCWKDTGNRAIPTLEGKDARLDGSYTARANAIEKCYQVAKSLGYRAFAVQNGGWCAGSATAHKTYKKYGPYSTCQHDGEGGAWGNEVYLISGMFIPNKGDGEVAKIQGPKYLRLGCWKDSSNRAITTLEKTDERLDGSYTARADAIEKCYQVAKSRGFSVFSVQNGGECFGSATALGTYKKYGPSSSCQADGEGGAWANEVYLIKTGAPIALPKGYVPKPYISIGCWRDSGSRAIPTLEGKDKLLDGSYTTRAGAIDKCYQVAKSRGYRIFAVQTGGWCAGSADAYRTYKKYGPYTTCGKDGEGGAWGNEVYLISDVVRANKAEKCQEENGVSYRGTVSVTRSGKTCQHWASQTPQKHDSTPDKHPLSGLDGNYCRNPVGARQGVWCYTTDPSTPWEECAVPVCAGPEYISLGCWKDTGNRAIAELEKTDERLDGTYTARENAIEKCYQVAKSRGFFIFAVQNGGWCAGAGAGSALVNYRKYGPSASCKKDGEGGPWANEVYLITGATKIVPQGFVPKPYFSIGCWKDTGNRAIPTLEGKDARLDGSYTARADAIEKCYQVAKSLGYRAFAVQNGGWCAGSATAHKTYNKYGPYSTCQHDGEGGAWGNEVYLISGMFIPNKGDGEVAKIQGPKYLRLGCWKDSSNRAITTLEKTDERLDGSYTARADAIEKCYQVAKSRGFSVFAVQNGGECFGSATALGTYKKYGPSSSCQADGEGGSWANEVYLIKTGAPIALPKGYVPKPYISIGCWRDSGSRAIPTLEGKDKLLDDSYTTRAGAIDKCYQVAKSRGYRIFAVQNGGWCAGSADAYRTYKMYGPYTTCGKDGEGGAWGNEVYLISDVVRANKAEKCQEENGVSYRGTVSVTRSGKTCQHWASQTPQKHDSTPDKHPLSGLDGNYCRNPVGARQGVWCYTTDPSTPWEECAVPVCAGPEYISLGCWKDTGNRAIAELEKTDERLDGTYTARENAIEKCYQVAKSRGFFIFAVQNGGWCAGAGTGSALVNYRKYGPSASCKKDGEGGPWANEVYLITGATKIVPQGFVPKPYFSIGCWKDTGNRAIPTLEGKDARLDGSYAARANAIEKCYQVAKSLGYRAFAVQNGGWCAGSATAHKTYNKYGPYSTCQHDGEGGAWGNEVYLISGMFIPNKGDGEVAKIQGPKYLRLGCWKDSSNRAIPTLEKTDERLDGSYTARADAIEKCYQVAKSRGFSVFAVQNGGECFGSATALGTYKKYGPSSSCQADGEGGGWANEVYLIKTGAPIALPKGYVPKPYISIGCWRDSGSRAIPTLEGKDKLLDGSYTTRAGAIDKCYQVAKSRGYRIFAVQNGGWCAGSADAYRTYKKYGPYTTCGKDGEGGAWGNEVYLISDVVRANKAEKCQEENGVSYRGTISVTRSGKTCQHWASQTPQKHDSTPDKHPLSGLDGNYCRNPVGARQGVWCYTTDPSTPWEECAVPVCPGPEYISLGCWKDTGNRAIAELEKTDERLDGTYTARENAIEKCYQVAKSRGFFIFAVQNGGWCAGAGTGSALVNYRKYGPSASCKKDGEGGPWANEVYLITGATKIVPQGFVPKPYFSIGCWKDTGNRAIPTLEGKDARLDGSYAARANAIEKCYQVAKSLGYRAFAVQNGGWCAGSATAHKTYNKYGPYSTCQHDGEGGAWGNEVYLISGMFIPNKGDGEVAKIQGPKYLRLGCWKDSSNRAITTLEKTDERLDGSYTARADAIEKCYQVAKSRGFSVFAVQNGGECFGSAAALGTYKKYGPSSSCQADGEGGSWANEVYLIKTDAPIALPKGYVPKPYISIGCWRDSGSRAIPTLEGKDKLLDGSYPTRAGAIDKCYQVAKSRGYRIFAVQNGGWCAGSADAYRTYRKYGPYTTCGKDGEGGAWGNEVYLISDVVRANKAEKCQEENGVSYRGTVSVTRSGKTCQHWASQTPQKHDSTPDKHPLSGLDGNYCRNPVGARQGVWCYTTDPSTPWEECAVPVCAGPEYISLGCWKDTGNRAIAELEKTDERLDGTYTARENAIEKCYQVAKSRGFFIFAVQNGGWCAGAGTGSALVNYRKYGPSASCKKDGEGGPWANEVYLITGATKIVPQGFVPKPYFSIGCWKDTGNRAIPTLEGKDARLDGSYTARANAIEKCYQVAKSLGYRAFAVQNGGWCAGSATAHKTYNKYGPYSTCQHDGEGGAWGNEVYLISGMFIPNKGDGEVAKIQGPKYLRLGCWKDSSNRAITTLEKTDARLDGSYPARADAIEKCYQVAKSRGFSVFAVQNGGECFGSATALGTYKKYGPSSSCKADGEGGAWANEVYLIKTGAPIALPKGYVPKPYISIGCWRDSGSRAIPTLEGKDKLLDGSYTTRAGAIEKCYQVAKSRGYRIFAVQNGGWCAGSADAYRTYNKYGPYTTCGKDGEGGAWGNEVYLISDVVRANKAEKCQEENGVSYRGTVSVTRSGKTCQHWASQTPQKHDSTPDKHPLSGLDGNYCRNPVGARQGVWCYTTDPSTSWEECAVPVCAGPEYISLGCWKDTGNRAIAELEKTDARLDGTYTARENAIEKCYQVAKSRGFFIFAVQNGGQCFGSGSTNALVSYQRYGPSASCKKDGEGGSWANEVYLITGALKTLPPGFVPKPYFSIGCWKDTGNRAIPTLEGKDARLDGSYTARADAIEKCYQVAKSLGYRAFAVQHGGWCAGSTTAHKTYNKYGPYSTCQHDGEGGPWGNEVYLISDMMNPSVQKGGGAVAKVQGPRYISLGCWKDTNDRAIAELEKTDERLDGTYAARKHAIEKCYQVAKSRGFSVFAVQHGGQCFGSATGFSTYKKYGSSSGCGKDGEGGAHANEVYLITGVPVTLPEGYVPKPYISLGCWRDSGSRAIPTLEGKDKLLDGSYTARAGAIDKCYQVAKSRGYRIFAVQNGGWCAGSADAYRTYKKYGPYTTCKKDGEGGAWGNEVYLISDALSPSKGGDKGDGEVAKVQGPKYISLGCWRDTGNRAIATLEGADARLDGSYTARADAIEKCYQVAKSRGFSVFAVQNGGWCAGSANALSTYRKYGPSAACGKDGEGGGWANEVYLITGAPITLPKGYVPKPYFSIGCWKDTGNRAIPTLEGKDARLDGAYRARANAIEKCYQVAKSRGFQVFAVQHGGWCAGSANALSTYKKYGPYSTCQKDGEGGAWGNEVYLISDALSPSKGGDKGDGEVAKVEGPKYISLGCWRDTGNRAIATLEGADARLDGSYPARADAIEKCYQVAKSRGFSVFAVQNGGWCAGSATALSTYRKYGPSAACGKDGEGGAWANEVYLITGAPITLPKGYVPKPYFSIGCWKDTGNRAIPTLEGKDARLDGAYRARSDAIEKCYQVAKSRGFQVFAVQHGGWCAGSATALSTYKKYGPYSTCQKDGEGGAWGNEVYLISDALSPSKGGDKGDGEVAKVQGPKYISLGCWKDTGNRAIATLEGADARLDGSYTARADVIEKCYQVAKSRGFSVFAVQNGGWCAGSATALSTYRKYGPSAACGKDGEGGAWANEVYLITGAPITLPKGYVPKPYFSIGCWKDTGNRAIPTLEGKDARLDGSYTARANAIDKCYQVAKSRGFQVFAVQHGGWCAGSATALSTYKKYGPYTTCKEDGEGGAWGNEVYLISDALSPSKGGDKGDGEVAKVQGPKYISLGCWRDTGNRAIATLEGEDARLDGSYTARADAIEKCYQVAKSRGFSVFAVQNGGWCAGSATALSTYRKYGPSAACQKDGEGGAWANEVYLITGAPITLPAGYVPKPYFSIGCWKDTGNRAIPTLEGKDARLDGSYTARADAIEKCYQVAKSLGYRAFAVQNGGWCAGSANALSTYKKYGPYTTCKGDGEGGAWGNEVYLISGLLGGSGFSSGGFSSGGVGGGPAGWLRRDPSWVVSSAGTPWKNGGVTYDAAKALDGSTGTYWNPQETSRNYNNWYIELDLKAPYTLSQIAINNFGDTTHDVKAFKLQKSQSGAQNSWEDVTSVGTVQGGTNRRQEFGGFQGTARYWRFVVTQTHSGWQPYLVEVDFYGSRAGGEGGKVQGPKYISLGCWKDTGNRAIATLEGADARLDGSYTARADAIEKCYQVAKSRGYSVFAVQNGGWCAGSANALSTYRKYGRSAACGKDGEGGGWANEVYLITGAPITLPAGYVPKPYFSIGCWKDTGNRAIPTLEGKDARLDGSYTARANAIEKCYQVAKSLGYRAFAVQNGGWCAGSANALSTYKKYGPYTTCKEDGEGGAWGNEVYLISGLLGGSGFSSGGFSSGGFGGGPGGGFSGGGIGGGSAVGTTNIALNRPAAQSSDVYGGTAGRAVDGNDSPQWADGSCTHTANGPNPWWRVDLGRSQAVGRVVVTNRKDCCSDRLEGFTVYVGDSPEVLSNPTCGGPQSVAGKGTITVSCGGLTGRYVGIALKGAQRTLTLCEVKVFGGGGFSGGGIGGGSAIGTTNIALNRPAAQSSDVYGGTAGRAVDGNDNPQWAGGSCTHTANGPNPWWRVDLGSSQAVGRVVVTNRKDCCSDRLEGFTVYVGDSPEVLSNPTCGGPQSVAGKGTITVSCGGLTGRYVGIALKGAQRTLTLCEVKVFGGGEVGKVQGPKYISLGCWKDTGNRAIATLEGADARLDGSYTARADAIEKCYQVAKSRGYSVFAVQNGGWCAGSANALSTYRKYGRSSGCGKDGEGGGWANEVYLITGAPITLPAGYVPKPYFSIGCWKDTGNRAIPTLEGKDARLDGSYTARANAIEKCYQVAKSLGYRAFAVQNGGWCAGSATALSTYKKYGPYTTCKGDGEGGAWGNEVYLISGLLGGSGFSSGGVSSGGVGGGPAVGPTNIALNRPAAQSSDAYGGTAGRAVDGNDNPQWAGGSCTHTVNGPNPWWRVDLGSSQTVGRVVVTNRKDCCSDRLEGFTVYVGDNPEVLSNPTCGGPQSVAGKGTITVSCGGLTGRYVGIALKGAQRTLTLCEVKVFGGGEVGKVQGPKYISLGCWKDTGNRAIATLEGADARLDGSYTARADAIEKCYQVAKSRGYSVFAVQNGGWCAGSANALSTYRKYGRSSACGKDGEGGGWANEVYLITGAPITLPAGYVPKPYFSIGCWKDTGNRAIPTLEGKDARLDGSYTARANAIEKCYQVAKSLGYRAFAVQNGGWCAGSATALSTYKKYGPYTTCKGDGEGGAWGNEVYLISGLLGGSGFSSGGVSSGGVGGGPAVGTTNIALNRPAAQSSDAYGGTAGRAVDGNDNPQWAGGSCTHTVNGPNPWWRVDLGSSQTVGRVVVTNRKDCCSDRLEGFTVYVGDNPEVLSNPTCGGPQSVAGRGTITVSCGGLTGRYVGIALKGAQRTLTLCEVKVFGGGGVSGGGLGGGSAVGTTNIALNRPAAQSSVKYGAPAGRAVDGDDNPQWVGGSCTHTAREPNPWWRVDLGSSQAVGRVVVTNRKDCCSRRLKGFTVYVGDSPEVLSNPTCGGPQSVAGRGTITVSCGGLRGRYVGIALKGAQRTLTLCEVKVFGGTSAAGPLLFVDLSY